MVRTLSGFLLSLMRLMTSISSIVNAAVPFIFVNLLRWSRICCGLM